ncbi:MAG: pyridoxal phosphate-dependent aminotransferase [Deltaproteobacteria bacterium]|nr:pyridoxal phosphate-dependent aminotransferase [Deltaproteobacteria bacterium]MBW2121729.1 pyridoxal phosphate-dependent aminotransferase [Deltaproteobacteria bacterium]
MNLYADRIQNLGTENAFKIGDDIRRCEQQGMKVVKLNLGEPDFNSAENINQVAIENIRAGNSHYTDPQGILPLRESICRHLLKTRGITVDPRQVVVTTGAKPPISYTMMTYVNPGDEVIYPSPGFPIYESWVTFVGAVPVPLHLEEDKGFRFDAADLERLISPRTKILIINSPSNPTGGVLTGEDLAGIARVVKDRADPNIRIYSDEVYEDIIFDGKEHESIVSIPDMANNTILESGHSKSFAMTGWRLGYAVLPTVEEAMVFRQLNINLISCTPPFIQEAGREALDNEENRRIIAAMVAEFEKRRDVVVEALNRIEGIHCNKPEGAFYVFPNIGGVCADLGIIDAYEKLPPETKKRTSPSTMFQMFALYRHGVATMDRRSFGVVGSEGKHYLRLSTATDIESLKEGVRRIEAAAKDKKGFEGFIKEGEHLF